MTNHIFQTPLDNGDDSSIFRTLPQSSSLRTTSYEILESIDSEFSSKTGNFIANTDNLSYNNSQRELSDFEKRVIESVVQHDTRSKEQYALEIKPKLINRLKLYNYDEDSENYIWSLIDEIIIKVSLHDIGSIFQDIVIKYNDFPNILCAIAKCLCSFELNETMSWGPMILIALFSHRNETVKEYAVMLLDNWEDRSLLPILRNLDCRSIWLQEYINCVVKKLEE